MADNGYEWNAHSSVEIHSGVRQGCAPSPTPINYIFERIPWQAMQSYPGTEVYTDVYVFDFTYADDIMLLTKNYRKIPVLLEAGNHSATAVGVPIKAAKTKAMSTLAAASSCPACR